jgi:xanthine dehydrogenase YagS FAD-binding subunit
VVPFTIAKATSEDDAIATGGRGGRYIAGGTTLVDLMREEVERPSQLVDINRLPLNSIRLEHNNIVIGALARMAEVAAHPDVRRLHPLIAEALEEGASPQLRNMASIGGNLMQRVRCPYFRMLDASCNKRSPGAGCAAIEGVNGGHAILGTSESCVATHPSDLAVALVALDATMRVRGPQGERRFRVEDLYRLPEGTPHLEHTLRPGELILDVRVPLQPFAVSGRYLKVRDRSSYEFALVSTAVALHVQSGIIRAARVACGGVGTRPWRMPAVEKALLGQRATRASFETAAERATLGARALSGNAYKLALLPRVITRALEMEGEKA